ncbi:hypothetical protein Z043_123305 [Scleropages formosus]|uniref:Uncharacterized protein n=1 Tax=Scleropages formosus TaxID=113540 RepID=A0A0P7TMA9_SCLFO|nr:hypothetical protein Z043_123305 [Scleropages formosus]
MACCRCSELNIKVRRRETWASGSRGKTGSRSISGKRSSRHELHDEGKTNSVVRKQAMVGDQEEKS